MQTKGLWGQTNPTTQQDLTVGVDLSPQKCQQDINLSWIYQISVVSSLETPTCACMCVCVCATQRELGVKHGIRTAECARMSHTVYITLLTCQTGQN